MEIQPVNNNEFVDLFDLGGNADLLNKSGFGMADMGDTDLFSNSPSTTTQTTVAPSTTTQTTQPVVENKEEPVVEDADKEVDILSADQEGKDKSTKYEFSDMKGYFEDRLKSGKFTAIEEELENGEKRMFIPSSPEEFDEVIELQVNYKIEQAKKELEANWYKDKSPAWKAVAQYAEMVDNPAEVMPFIQGVNNIQYVSQIDIKEVEGAETLIRLNLESKGLAPELIETQIDALKTTDKLLTTAEKLQPQMLQEEQRNLAQMMQTQKQKEQEYFQMVADIQDKAIQAIESPLFGTAKLKQEEKLAVYNLIGEPNKESGGYQIYNKIDELFDKRDFETLKQIALLLENRDAFLNYAGVKAATKTATDLRSKLSIAGESRKGSSNDYHEENRVVINRNTTGGKPRFGRAK